MIDQKNKNSNREINLNRYETDIDGVSMKTLNAGLWWAKNRGGLKSIFIILLAAVSIISWGYTVFNYGSYLFVGMNYDNQILKNITYIQGIDQNYRTAKSAKNLVLSNEGYIPNDNKYDLYIRVQNPNPEHWAKFDYCFTRPNSENVCGKDFILAGETKYVLALGRELKSQPNDLNFKISNITWSRIDKHSIPDYQKYKSDRINIEVSDIVYTPASQGAISEKIPLNSLTFKVENKSAYNYYQVPLNIIFSNGSSIISINRYLVDNFTSHQTREASIIWGGSMYNYNNLSITPDINIMDIAVFNKP